MARVVTESRSDAGSGLAGLAWLAYPLLGVCFGITLTKSEVLSWFRIQEMFRFQSPRMYEIIASAVAVAALSIALIKRLGVKTASGEPIAIRTEEPGAWDSVCGGRHDLRPGLGPSGRLPGTDVRALRERHHRDDCRYRQCDGRNMAVRTAEVSTPSLMAIRPSGRQ